MIRKSLFVPAMTFLIAVSPLAGGAEPNESAESVGIKTFVRTFLRAFENLYIQQFVACFADNATVFFPMPDPPERVEGKRAIKQRFEQVLLVFVDCQLWGKQGKMKGSTKPQRMDEPFHM